jgi:hypothetical protein
VAHAYNPSYLGGRDQEDHDSKPAPISKIPNTRQGKQASPGTQFNRPYLKKKKPSQKRAGGVAQGVGPEFKPQCRQKKKIFCPGLMQIEKNLTRRDVPCVQTQVLVRWKDCGLRPAWEKKLVRPHPSKQTECGGSCLGHPSYIGGIGRRLAVLGWAKMQDPV